VDGAGRTLARITRTRGGGRRASWASATWSEATGDLA
jgi:hypothetical protein